MRQFWGWLTCILGTGLLMLAIRELQHGRQVGDFEVFVPGFWAIVLLAVSGRMFFLQETESMHAKIKALSPLAGKTLAQVKKKLGPPRSTEYDDSGRAFVTWTLPGYSITLVFRDNVCERVAKEVEDPD